LQMDVEAQTLQCYGETSSSVAGTINATKRQGTATLPGVSAAFGSWINTNEEKNGGTDNTASDGTTVPQVAGSNTQLEETKLQNLLDGVWNNSGDFTNTKIMASAATVTSLRALKGMATDVNTSICQLTPCISWITILGVLHLAVVIKFILLTFQLKLLLNKNF
jgi:hypothetical protein